MKEFMKSLNSSGFHICLLNLSVTAVLIEYLDFPTSAFTWPIAIETRKVIKFIKSFISLFSKLYCIFNLKSKLTSRMMKQNYLH